MEADAGADGGFAAVIVLLGGAAELTVGRIVDVPVDLALVGVLARLQLHAQRQGRAIRLRTPTPALQELLRFVGLGDLIEPPSDPQPR